MHDQVAPGVTRHTESAPAKLTLSLRVSGVRNDGYHLIDSEMVSLDLADTLHFDEGDGMEVVDQVVGGLGTGDLNPCDNTVLSSLRASGRKASVRLVKRIPPGAGLGGGSSDAAAVFRWAGRADLGLAAAVGADVPFCLRGGRARVTGIGEIVEPLPFERREFVLMIPPLSVSTTAVYRAWDGLRRGAGDDPRRQARDDPRREAGGVPMGVSTGGNDLERAAVFVEPLLGHWRDVLGEVTRRRPRLAGSGSTWFVEGAPKEVGLEGRDFLVMKRLRAPVVPVVTTPALD